ncbi:MAG TPA: response regulator [Kofleriaceae bacterium]|nr:response regulator [Kofleriaceae bacterium]
MARVLVIDDEPDVVRLVVKVLSGRGHVVAVARDGATALTRVEHEPPDVVLVDSDLPKIDGAEVCRRIKARPATQRIPVLMMTPSYIDLYDVGAEGGPDAFIVRPFVREVLANAVERVLYRR